MGAPSRLRKRTNSKGIAALLPVNRSDRTPKCSFANFLWRRRTCPAGTWLGLAIAKASAERMSGSLTAPNRAACGACACLTVPLADRLG
jgi:K+-sensing histidine kinase KdpD